MSAAQAKHGEESPVPGGAWLRQGSSVAAAFSDAARRHHDRTATTCAGRSVSYRELETRSSAIAHGLIGRGLRPGAMVGLYMARSIDTIAAILGVLKAGAAYVPFDPSYPAALLEFIREDSAPSMILAQRALLDSAPAGSFGAVPVLDVATDFPESVAPLNPLPAVGPDDCAYVMYTSGSTGRPKGVQVPHRAILRLVIDNDFAHFGADETILQMAPLAFDASTFEIWGALLHGGRLAILADTHPSLEAIAAIIATEQVSTCWLTAGLFHLMVDHQLAGLRPLRQLLAGGDVLSVEHVAKALAGLPGCRLINGYGPTENTTFSCCYTIPRPLPPGPVPIGRAIRHCQCWLLDAELREVADGETGELFVGGPGLALGYLNRPELNAERFVAHPFDKTPGARLYRSGDRVRRRPDGNFDFLGRADRQVKINGKRVELDEIEATLRRSGLIADAAVTAPIAGDGQRRLAAYVTPQPGQTLALDALRRFLRAELAETMVPGTITVLDALPLSPTGKLDRNRLPAPAAAEPAKAIPGSELEARLQAIWQGVLGTQAVGLDDNFFDLGGTSLQMIKAHVAISAVVAKKPTLVDLFTYPRIRTLARWLAEPEARAAAPAGSDAQARARRQGAALARARASTRPTAP